MLLTIQNDALKVSIDTLGAQLMHIRSSDSCEYLWQGDPKYWPDRAPNLFPFIGRLWNNRYRFHGKPYTMGIHGFAAASEFTPIEQSDTHLVLRLGSSDATYAQYPVSFTLDITYRLAGCTLEITYLVHNHSEKTMPFGIGGHPGFRVPLVDGERFEDYALEFSRECQPDRVGFTPAVLLSGQDTPYPLEEGRRIPLGHELFDEDAIILKNMARTVTLRGPAGRGVTVSYPDMAYLGIWHWPKTDAPYVCIEPWTSLPARQDVEEELSCKSDLVHLAPGGTYRNTWSITILQEEPKL